MGYYIHMSRFFMLLIAMSMIMAVISIPIMYVMHTHSHEEERCDSHTHHKSDPDSGDTKECNLCEFYAQYIPKDANPTPPFVFQIPVAPLATQFRLLECEDPCDGLRDGYANKGPPSLSSLI